MVMEMAEGEPPYLADPPAEAMMKIKDKGIPPLNEPERWSYEMREFLSLCCQANPEERWSAAELLEHPFLQCSCTATDFLVVCETAQKTESLMQRDLKFLSKIGMG